MKFKTNCPNPIQVRYDDTGGVDPFGPETAVFLKTWRTLGAR
jgi:hypothetical protein